MTLEELEEAYMSGNADQVSGDVEAPTGHFYRVGRYIVQTDSQGFHYLRDCQDEVTATAEFDILDDEYSSWGDEDATDY